VAVSICMETQQCDANAKVMDEYCMQTSVGTVYFASVVSLVCTGVGSLDDYTLRL